MRDLLNRRDFLVTGSAGVAALSGMQLFSFPLAANAQGNRSSSLPRGTYVRADAGTDLLFLAGATALDLYHLHPHVDHEVIMPEDIIGQTHMVMRNLKEVLDDQNLTWRNVVKLNRYQTDLSESPAIEEVMAEYFGFWDWWPAMTAMKIRNLSSPPARLEIDIIAAIPSNA
ncbi:MAG: RidA family protein [Gammaproteobacteria bacterium]|nr:RidA family protein [Gammaproteobacteria bacterium]